MDALIDRERAAGSRDLSAEAWSRKLEECARLRRAYQDQQAAGLITQRELGERLSELDDARGNGSRTWSKTATPRWSRWRRRSRRT